MRTPNGLKALERRVARIEQRDKKEQDYLRQCEKERQEWLKELPEILATLDSSDDVSNPLHRVVTHARGVFVMAFPVQDFEQFIAKLRTLFEGDSENSIQQKI